MLVENFGLYGEHQHQAGAHELTHILALIVPQREQLIKIQLQVFASCAVECARHCREHLIHASDGEPAQLRVRTLEQRQKPRDEHVRGGIGQPLYLLVQLSGNVLTDFEQRVQRALHVVELFTVQALCDRHRHLRPCRDPPSDCYHTNKGAGSRSDLRIFRPYRPQHVVSDESLKLRRRCEECRLQVILQQQTRSLPHLDRVRPARKNEYEIVVEVWEIREVLQLREDLRMVHTRLLVLREQSHDLVDPLLSRLPCRRSHREKFHVYGY
mmetsp:Transcript_31239/g.52474  ORF Transcript_31239/g.52474 Transcript_31239/m.52474 type:complete len:269 (-) Transcript_31239:266-1072(-)